MFFKKHTSVTEEKEYLIRVEAINFDHSINDTNQLSVRRGGSIALHNAIKLIQEKFELEIIRSGGSIGIFQTKSNDIKQQTNEIKEYLSSNEAIPFLSSLTFSIQQTELPSDSGKSTQQQIIKELEAQSYLEQLQIPSFNFSHCIIDGSNEPCQYDGLLPQSEKRLNKNISKFSADRFDYGRNQKHNFINSLMELEENNKNIYVNDFESLSQKKNSDPRINKLKSKLAILYFDGNHFGKAQKDMILTEIQAFESELQSAQKSFISSLITLLQQEKYKNKADEIRLELLLWGGDEIMLAVPAWAGFTTLHLFYKTMQNKLPDLTHAGGLVFCHHKTPIKRMMRLSRELAEEAKKISRKEDLYYTLLLESEDYPTQSITEFWRQHYGELGSALLPQKPYPEKQPDYKEYISNETSRTGLYKSIYDLYQLYKPNISQQDKIDLKIKEINDKSNNSELTTNKLAEYFPLFSITGNNIDQNNPDQERLNSLETNTPDLHRIQPWIYLREYGDYLIKLEQQDQPTAKTDEEDAA